MVSSLLGTPLDRCFGITIPAAVKISQKFSYPPPRIFFQQIQSSGNKTLRLCSASTSTSPTCKQVLYRKSLLPLAASLAFLLWSSPANAGFLSGSTGIESVPGPELPQIDSLTRFNEENQKRYAENDARFKESPLLKRLLEKSKLNKEKNKQEIQDKYCLRGAEWGIGDCSAEGMSLQDREEFIAMLKKKAGVE